MFEIQLARGAKARGGTLVTAFPSVGMVGTIAGSFVSESLKTQRIGFVLSDSTLHVKVAKTKKRFEVKRSRRR
jgi:predicted ATP-grasp superfamily ATP-dependent carboligase